MCVCVNVSFFAGFTWLVHVVICGLDPSRELVPFAGNVRARSVSPVRSALLLVLWGRAMFLVKRSLPSDVSRTDYSFQ